MKPVKKKTTPKRKPKPAAKPAAKRAAKPAAPMRPLVKSLCRALEDKKAEDLRVLDVSEQSSITDVLVLATANSETHLRALRIEVDRILKEAHTHVVGQDAVQESGWIVVDAFDVMVHLFTAAQREHFGLENLWKDAREVSL